MKIQPDAWIGRQEVRTEKVEREPFRRLRAMLDQDPDETRDIIPPLGHWLCFLPDARQSALGPDGHPGNGTFLPDFGLPMRMWAGSRLTYSHPIRIGEEITRTSTLVSVEEKTGRTGPLAFVTVRNELRAGDQDRLTEELDIVFRDRSGQGRLPPGEHKAPGDRVRTVQPETSLLFRYSALTFNSHRIHYDRDYAVKEEGYPGLVVHGPLLATLLMDHFISARPDDRIRTFEFRARRPIFDQAPFTVHLTARSQGAELWAAGPDQCPAMTAEVTTCR
jgi:3-methylfumaryl-CoA hydratase